MAIDPYARYGNTSPVKCCGEDHGVPVEHAYVIADHLLHGRWTVWNVEAEVWLAQNFTEAQTEAFVNDITEIVRRAQPKAA